MRHVIALLVLLGGWVSVPAAAQNLITNGDFDTDTSGWSTTLNADEFWDPSDERDLGGSGSLRAEAPDPTSSISIFSACTPVNAGTVYAFGGSVRVPEELKGVSFNVTARLRFTPAANCSGSLQSDTGDSTVLLTESWGPVQGTATAPPGATHALLLFNIVHAGTPVPLELFVDNAFLVADRTCINSFSTLCLNDGRFRVWAEWERPDGSQGFARTRPLTDDSGYLWFFKSTNIELVTKVLDACAGATHRFWAFTAGLTNVGVTLRVRDTVAGVTRTYENPLGDAFLPVQDTDAFATCP